MFGNLLRLVTWPFRFLIFLAFLIVLSYAAASSFGVPIELLFP